MDFISESMMIFAQWVVGGVMWSILATLIGGFILSGRRLLSHWTEIKTRRRRSNNVRDGNKIQRGDDSL